MKKIMILAVAALVLTTNAMQAANKPVLHGPNNNNGMINKLPSKPVTGTIQHGPINGLPVTSVPQHGPINGLPIIASKPTHSHNNWFSHYHNYPNWYRSYCFFDSYSFLNWGWYYPTWYGRGIPFFGW